MTTDQIIAQVNPDCGMDIAVMRGEETDFPFVAVDRNSALRLCGYGRTPLDAIIDLLDSMEGA